MESFSCARRLIALYDRVLVMDPTVLIVMQGLIVRVDMELVVGKGANLGVNIL